MYYGIQIFPYFTDNSSLENNTLNSTTQQNAFTARGGVRYYSSTVGSLGFYANGTYGVYFSGAPSASSSGNVYSFKLSKIQARCNGTYFATARKAYIDSANTNIVVTADVYKTPVPKSIISHYIEELRADMTTGL